MADDAAPLEVDRPPTTVHRPRWPVDTLVGRRESVVQPRSGPGHPIPLPRNIPTPWALHPHRRIPVAARTTAPQAVLQQLRNPLRITDIAFATGHPLHVRGVEQPHHHDLFQAVERLRQRDEVDSIAAILTPISTAEGAGMIVELRVGEQRYRAVWEVLDGASVTEGRVGSRCRGKRAFLVQRVGPANPSGRRSAALRTTQDLCRQQERQSGFAPGRATTWSD